MAIGASIVSGCGNSRYSALSAATDKLVRDISQPAISLEEAARVPYASLGVRLDGGPEAMAILADATDGICRWSIGDDTSLLTRGGRIVGWYRGSAVMLDHTGDGKDPVAACELGAPLPATCVRQADFPERRRYGVVLTSRIIDATSSGETTRRRWVERGGAETLGWNFENTFEFDRPTGHCLYSWQQAAPELATIELRVLRPYADTGAPLR